MIPSKNIFRILITGLLLTICIYQPARAGVLPEEVNTSVVLATEPSIPLLNWTAEVVNFFDASRLKTKILLVVLAYLSISFVALFLIIMVNRARKSRSQKQAEKIRNIYHEELTNFLFGDDNQPFEFTGIRHPFNRKIFINELLSLHNNLHGEAATRLRDLYFNLEFYKDSLSKVHQNRWNIKAKGFREAAQMDIKDALNEISSHINSKNPVLRMEAQVAMVKLIEDDPLQFLDDLKFELSIWEQINIINTLDYHQITIDTFERWLMVQNQSVIKFAARMTGILKHTHAAPALIPLLRHESPQVRHTAIEALGRMEMPEYMDELKLSYYHELPVEPKKNDAFFHLDINKNRLAVVKAICRMATNAEIEFLTEVLKTDIDFDILLLTARTLASFGPAGVQILDKLKYNDSDDLVRIIENVKQNHI